MRIAILGRTQILYETMNHIQKAGHEIVLVGTCKAVPEYTVNERDFEIWAKKNKTPFFCNANLEDEAVIGLLKKVRADIAISMNWINLIKDNVMQCFLYGILNAHAGDLPRFRGNACPNWALILGEKKIGVSIHFMQPGELDSGNVLVKQYLSINSKTMIGNIYLWLNKVVPEMFVEAINGIEKGSIVEEKQSVNKKDILRVYPRKPEDSIIQWTNDAEKIERLVNASSKPFSGAYTFYKMKKLVIWEAFASEWEIPSIAIPGQVIYRDKNNGYVGIACGKGLLHLKIIEIDDAGTQRPFEIIKSMRDRLGMSIEDEIYNLRTMVNKLLDEK